MSEQLLTVIGTLGAALLGFIGIIFTNYQNNRYQTELQEQRYEQEEAARTRERKIELLEELFSLTMKLKKGRSTYLGEKDENGQPIFPLTETIDRITVIVLLYFTDIQEHCFKYLYAHKALQDIFHETNKIEIDPDNHGITVERAKQLQTQLPIAIKNFEETFAFFLTEIKMVAEELSRGIGKSKRKRRYYNVFQRMRFRIRRMILRIRVWRRKHGQKSHK